jgi:nucleoid-associated protein EbfC
MFGNLGQMASLLKNAGAIKENLSRMNERLAAARYVGDAGGGQVRATVDGRGDVVALKIDPAILSAGDVEFVEDLAVAALRAAIAMSRSGLQHEMEAATGGMKLDGLTDLLKPPT